MCDWRTISTVRKIVNFLVVAGVFLTASTAVWADDTEREKTAEEMQKYRFKTVTTPEGLNFNIPEDMPIETRNGIKAPIPYDEYQYFKYKKLEEKLSDTNAKIDKMVETLDKMQRTLEALKKKNPSSAPSSS